MKATLYVEIKNISGLKEVWVDVIWKNDDDYVFSLLGLDNLEFDLIKEAVSNENDNIKIETFIIDGDKYVNFGPDYDFYIIDDKLVGKYTRE